MTGADTDELTAAGLPPSPAREAWLSAVAAALKGAGVATLRSVIADGLTIEPLYGPARGARPVAGRPAGQRWSVVQRVDHPDAAQANALALADLEGGANGLTLVFAASGSARGFGLRPAILDAVLADVDLGLIGLRLDAGEALPEALASLLAVARRRGIGIEALDLRGGYDPVAVLAREGRLPEEPIGALIETLMAGGHRGPVLTADARPYHEAGASPAQELAAVLGAGLAHLRLLEAAGIPPADAADRIDFTLAADQDMFLTIAKLRALRRLWMRICAACGTPARPAWVHVETAWRMLTRRDAATNMLRGTIAAFAAALGGADSITILPHSAALGLPDGFARRLARNAQHVLMEEASLHRIADPAAGSGAFETLSDGLSRQAWSILQAIEDLGGIATALTSGWLPIEIAAAAAPRTEPAIVGTTRFAADDDKPPAVLAPAPAGPAATQRTIGLPLPRQRLAEPFEGRTP